MYHRFTGALNALSNADQKDAALAELLATTGEGFNVKSFGAKGDGVTDDAAAIQTAIDAAATNGDVVFPGGDYLINTMLIIPSKSTLRGYGRSSRIVTGDVAPFKCGVASPGAIVTDVVIRDLYFDTTAHITGQTVELWFIRCIDIVVENVTVEDYWHFGIGIDSCQFWKVRGCTTISTSRTIDNGINVLDDFSIPSAFGVIEGNICRGPTTGNDIEVLDARHVIIDGNVSEQSSISVFRASDVIVSNNRVKLSISIFTDDVDVGQVPGDIIVTGNQITDGFEDDSTPGAIRVQTGTIGKLIIANNNIKTAPGVGIRVTQTGSTTPDSVIITGNVISAVTLHASLHVGIKVDYVTGLVITDNTIGTCDIGIQWGADSGTATPTFVVCKGNVINGAVTTGINIKSNKAIISSNVIDGGTDGILVANAITDLIITDNFFSDASGTRGILLGTTNDFIVISGNIFGSGLGEGLKTFISADNNVAVSGNVFHIATAFNHQTARPSLQRGNMFSVGGLMSGTAALTSGTVTISTNAILASDTVHLTKVVGGGSARGVLEVGTIVAGTSFVITSMNATASAETNDTSTVFWEIVH